MILFLVTYGNSRVVTYATGREDAKRKAHTWLGYESPYPGEGIGPDNYTVTPLTNEGDRIKLDVLVNV